MATQFESIKEKLLHTQHTWLITGVAGFIGSNLLEALLKLNQKVIGLDSFVTGHRANIDDVLQCVSLAQRNNFTFYEGDVCSAQDCRRAMANVHYVLHQAALGSVPRSIEYPEITHNTNATGFLNILVASKEAKVRRFVYASSSSVYGDSPVLPKKEEHIGFPLSPYAVSKYTNELYARAFANCYGIETIGLRYFNVFGPRQDPNGPYAAVIPRWIQALQQGKPIYINGDGETTRDFCFIDNAIQANLLAALTENPKAINTVYNVAVGEQNTLNTLFEIMVEMLSLPNKPERIFQEFRSGDIRHSLADIDKAESLLQYKMTHTLHQGLNVMLNNLKN